MLKNFVLPTALSVLIATPAFSQFSPNSHDDSGGGRYVVANGTGNGVTDDTAAIQAAANRAAGGTLYFPCAPVSYLISGSITIRSNTKVTGAGYCAKIQANPVGWTLVPHTGFGILNLYDVKNVEISGVHFYGTTTAALGVTPKLIYYDTVSNIDIHDNVFENQGYEGIWGGGTGKASLYINVHHNYFYNVGIKSGLPNIQMNCAHSVVEGNIIVNPGTGIGMSGQYLTAVGNHIFNPSNTGIGTGDGAQPAGLQIVGNSIEYDPTHHTVTGIGLYGGNTVPGQDGPDEIQVTSNYIKASAAPGTGFASNGIFGGTAREASIQNNVVELTGSGAGIFLFGTAGNGSSYTLYGNTVRFLTETAFSVGVYGVPNKDNNTISVVSADNRVFGLGSAYGSYAYSFNHNSGGTETATQMNDFATGGALLNGAVSMTAARRNIAINFPQVPVIMASSTLLSGLAPTVGTGSYNVASIKRSGAGTYSVTFTNSLSSGNYQVTFGAGSQVLPVFGTRSSTGFSFDTYDTSGVLTDFSTLNFTVTQVL